MSRELNVYFLPELAHPNQLADTTVVVADVLRATTTMTAALMAGALRVIPCLDIETAKQLHMANPPAVLGGERKGLRIPGFDLGNSPLEYTPAVVQGKTVVMTTTNGTRALLHCRAASEIYVAAFVNLTRTAESFAHRSRIAVVCAGTDQQVTQEDVLFAGALASRLVQLRDCDWTLNDQAQLASSAWRNCAQFVAKSPRTRLDDFPGQEGTVWPIHSNLALTSVFRTSLGGRNLVGIGQDKDIEFAAAVDALPLAITYDPTSGQCAGNSGPAKLKTEN